MAFTAPFVLEYAYKRSLGPVIGRFYQGLRDGRLVGVRMRSGRVLVPPLEYDPETGEDTGEFVQLGDSGAIVSWTYVPVPKPGQPLLTPFCWALILLDGADTAMLHVVDAMDLRTGDRVHARWHAERVGALTDLHFEPVP